MRIYGYKVYTKTETQDQDQTRDSDVYQHVTSVPCDTLYGQRFVHTINFIGANWTLY